VLAPYKDGLPYDFDQVRVYTWNVKKHRYETAYRDRNIAGYLPVTVGEADENGQEAPTFSYRVATGEEAALDPQTGMVKAGETATENFRMDGVMVRRVGDAPARPAVARATQAPHRKTHRKKRQG
jgi:hypothetical protein